MQLKAKLDAQRREVQQFEDAVFTIREKPKFEPGNNAPLAFLKELLSASQDDQERAEKIAAMEQSLERGKAALEALENEYELTTAKAAEGTAKLQKLGEKLNQQVAAIQATLEQLKAVGDEYQPAFEEIFGSSALKRSLAFGELTLPSASVGQASVVLDVQRIRV